jgi:hypothetical protein
MCNVTHGHKSNRLIIQDQDPVLSWVSERLGVAMKQARFGLDKFNLIDLELQAA